jgi:hypothetical protein
VNGEHVSDAPIVKHDDLVAFADKRVDLRRDDLSDYRKQVNRLREKLEEYIDSHPDYALVKMLHAGSVAKSTALRTINDMDVAVYVKKSEAPSTEANLLTWLADRLHEAYPNLDSDQFVIQQHCVTVSFRGSGLDVDVVAVLYEGDDDDRGWLITKNFGERVLTSVSLHLRFIRSRRKTHGPAFTQFIRIVKWWVRQRKLSNESFRFKSFLVELICARLVDDGELDLTDYPKALEQFFAYVAKTGLRERIAFADYCDPKSLPPASTDAIEAFDPVNPENNVAKRYSIADREAIVAAAQDALDALTEAHYATTQGRAYDCWRDVLGPSFGR